MLLMKMPMTYDLFVLLLFFSSFLFTLYKLSHVQFYMRARQNGRKPLKDNTHNQPCFFFFFFFFFFVLLCRNEL